MTEDWAERARRVEDGTVAPWTAASASFQRFVAALGTPGFRSDLLGERALRFAQEQGAAAYLYMTEAGARLAAGAMRLSSLYRDDYVRTLPQPQTMTTPPPPVPSPPDGNGLIEWYSWYQRVAAWATEQQAWSTRFYGTLLEETGAEHVDATRLQTSAREFLEARLPGYVLDMAEVSAGFTHDVLSMTTSLLDNLTRALEGLTSKGLVVDVRGPASAVASTGVLIENNRNVQANVTCTVDPVGEFGLATTPVHFSLGAGESRPLVLHVALPAAPTSGPSPAGRVTIHGHGERDLVIDVRATVDPPEARAEMTTGA